MFHKVERSGGLNPPTHIGKDKISVAYTLPATKLTQENSERFKDPIITFWGQDKLSLQLQMYISGKKERADRKDM